MRSARTTPLATTILMAGIMLVAACAPQRQVPWRPAEPAVPALPPEPAGPPKAALLLPLSGSSEAVGQDLMDAAQMALFDAGANELELIPFDTGSEPEGAVVAARAAIAGGAKVIIGPLFGRSTLAVAPIAKEAGVTVLSLSNDSSVTQPGVWALGFQPEEQIARVVRFAAQSGITKMAALAPTDAYGSKAIPAFQGAVVATGTARLVDVATYPPDNSTPTEAVRRVATGLGVTGAIDERTTPPAPDSAILIADGGARLRAVASLLAYQDVDPRAIRHLGTMRFQDDPAVLVDPQLQGAWLAAPPEEEAADFTARFRTLFGRTPSPVAVVAYDTTAMVAGLSGQGLADPQQFMDRQGFVGRTGIFRLLPDGRTERGLAVMEVNQGSLRMIDPPPHSFTDQLAAR